MSLSSAKGSVLLVCLVMSAWSVTVGPDGEVNLLHEEMVRTFTKGPNSHHLLEQTFSKVVPTRVTPTEKDRSFYYTETRPYYQTSYDHGGYHAIKSSFGHGDDSSNYGLDNYTSEEEKVRFLCLVVGICGNVLSLAPDSPPLMSVYEWKQLEFDYPNERDRQLDLDSGYWLPHVAAPIDVDVYYGDRTDHKMFITIPRFQVGSPVTLGRVTGRKLNGNPIVAPYPSWAWHKDPTKCHINRLVSVYRVKIDECGRLWILDTGKYGDQQTCEPQLLAFDLKTDKLLHRITIPNHLLESRSILVTPTIDVRDNHCGNSYVYIADCQTYAIIVIDIATGRSWRAIDKTMYPYPEFGTFNIQGDQFDLMDGVLGMDLEPYIPGRERKLFYHSMSSPTQNWVYTSDLRNESRFTNDPSSSPEIFHAYKSKRSSQSCAMAIDRNGIAYFGLMSDTSINCWNTLSGDYGNNIHTIRKDPVNFQFASGVKVINNKLGTQELWFLTSRFQKIATGTLDTSEVNFRITAGKIPNILQNSQCRVSTGGFGFPPPVGGGYGFKRTRRS